jgi:chromosome segregation ATPase
MISGSVVATLFFLTFSPAAAEIVATEGKEGACLLNTRRSLAKSELAEDSEAHRQWRAQHALQLNAMKKSEDVLDDFVTAQKNAGTACSARLMEAKRALDSLNSEAKSLANQVNSHEEVLETESSNLNITKSSIKAVEEEYDADVTECDRLKAEAIKDMAQYEAELKELKEIANPKARYTDKTSVDIPKAPASLLELGEFTRQTCLAFVHFLNRRGRSSADPKEACDKQREELQEAFTKAWKDINDLKDDAKERSEDKSCYEAAVAKKTAALVPLAAAREQQTARIEHANDAIAALEPVVNMLKSRIERMKDHIDEVLTPECMEAGEVSEVLQNIRDLITMVEECPGGGKFRLAIPKDTEDEVIKHAPIQQRL